MVVSTAADNLPTSSSSPTPLLVLSVVSCPPPASAIVATTFKGGGGGWEWECCNGAVVGTVSINSRCCSMVPPRSSNRVLDEDDDDHCEASKAKHVPGDNKQPARIVKLTTITLMHDGLLEEGDILIDFLMDIDFIVYNTFNVSWDCWICLL